jgi:SAM-dependent methyltransferase
MSSTPQVTKGQSLWAQIATPTGARRMRADGTGGQFSRDGKEAVRLEKQHLMLKEVFDGRLFYSNITNPAPKILDIGFKAGHWSIEVLADHLPNATIYGLEEDTVLFKRAFERDYGRKLLRRLLERGGSYLEKHFKYVKVEHLSDAFPLADHQFDFSYARLPDVYCSDESWIRLFQELKRVTKPDGWAEVLHAGWYWTDEPSPLLDALLKVQIEVCKVMKIAPSGGPKMEQYLQAAGISKVYRYPRVIGETPHERQMLLRDIQAIHVGSRPIVEDFGIMDTAEFDQGMEQFVEEGHRKGFHMPFNTVCFQPKDQI